MTCSVFTAIYGTLYPYPLGGYWSFGDFPPLHFTHSFHRVFPPYLSYFVVLSFRHCTPLAWSFYIGLVFPFPTAWGERSFLKWKREQKATNSRCFGMYPSFILPCCKFTYSLLFDGTFSDASLRVVFFVAEPIYLMSRICVGVTHPCTPGTLPVPRPWLGKIDSFLPVAYRYDGLSVWSTKRVPSAFARRRW